MNQLIILPFFAFILVLYAFVMKIENGDLISPASIVLEMAIVSLLVMAYFIGKVNETLSIETIGIIVLALMFFTLGTLGIKKDYYKYDNITNIDFISNQYSVGAVFFSCFIVFVATFLYFREVRRISTITGFSNSSSYGMLYYYRTATLTENEAFASQSRAVGQLVIASFACSYLVLIDFTKRLISHTIKSRKLISLLEVLCIIVYVGQCILSGGRTQFLYYIESFIFAFVFYYIKLHSFNANFKIIKRIAYIMILTFIAFFFLGNLTGKTSKLNFTETLFVYAGSSFIALDKYIHGGVSFNTPYPGSNVFLGIIDILNRLGFGIEQHGYAAPFVNIAGVSTNIYGAYTRYYNDFGLLGMVFFCFFIGAVYKMLYKKLLNANSNIELKLAIYLVCSKALFDFCIEERFFLSVISLGTILRIMYLFAFYFLFKKVRIRLFKRR